MKNIIHSKQQKLWNSINFEHSPWKKIGLETPLRDFHIKNNWMKSSKWAQSSTVNNRHARNQLHLQAVSHRDTQNIKILAYLSFFREVVIFTSNGKMIFYQYYVNIVRQTIIWRRGLVLFTHIFLKDFVKEDIKFTSKIVSDFRLVFVLLCKDDIWLMS